MLVDISIELVDLDLVGLDDISDEEVAKVADEGLDICSIDEATLARDCVCEVFDTHGPLEPRAEKARVRGCCCCEDSVHD